MCGRYVLTSPIQALNDLFGTHGLPNLGPNYNVAPTQAIPIIREEQSGRQIRFARWGLIPSWAKEINPRPLINARAETITEKASFKNSFKRRRCLIPADGFYEWQTRGDGSKQPFLIHAANNDPIAMAGIWDNWMGTDGGEVESVAIITTSANKTLKSLHHRMPVIINPGEFETWLSHSPDDRDDKSDMLKPAPDDLLTAHPVSMRVNRIANDDPDLIKPIELESEEPAKNDAPHSPQMDLF